MADGRIDFRELVKRLAQEYQTRIEMRQIGSRDEAKILGDVESCGQQCCCIRFLKSLKPVNMRMAKLQKATLDPSKISGYCGRLKCCLRYEDQTYTELKKRMPPRSTRVRTHLGEGKIIDYQILAQLVAVELDNGSKTVVPRDELEIISQPQGNIPDESTEETDAEEKGDNEQTAP
jgi:cell fate regulator YaaT (PSP1 superfamily)